MLLERIFAHARAIPDKPALVADGSVIRYRALAANIAAARRFLQRHILGADRVAVLAIASIVDTWVIGLAARSLGITTVTARTMDDIRDLDLGAVTLIVMTHDIWPDLSDFAHETGSQVITVSADALADAGGHGLETPQEPAGGTGGHIMLTSGTTGRRRKVLTTEANEIADIGLTDYMSNPRPSSVLNLFGAGGWTTGGYRMPFYIWILGGTIVVHQGPDSWRSLATPGLTDAMTQPQGLADLLAAPLDVSLRNDSLRLFVSAGLLPPALWRAAKERLTNDIWTIYGSTETWGCALTRVETEDDLHWHRIAPETPVEVVDDQDQTVPAGEIGMVRMGARGFTGYLNNEAATGDHLRDGYFYPGDLGMFREDRRLSIVGRVTDAINVGGAKVAAGEIERDLQMRLDADAICILSAPGPDGDALHVALQLSRTVTEAELKAALAETVGRLGLFQVQVHRVDSFPRNDMGKIDRVALRARLLT